MPSGIRSDLWKTAGRLISGRACKTEVKWEVESRRRWCCELLAPIAGADGQVVTTRFPDCHLLPRSASDRRAFRVVAVPEGCGFDFSVRFRVAKTSPSRVEGQTAQCLTVSDPKIIVKCHSSFGSC